MRNKITAVLLSVLISLLFTSSAPAQSIKQRMKSRQPALTQLKARGIIGENNTGYLQYMGENREQLQLVEAENRDRKTVYAKIAAQQGANVIVVGKRRAAKISQISPPGTWLQTPAGEWYKR